MIPVLFPTHIVQQVAFVNPVDVLRTRLFNQPFGPDGKGLRYAHGLDAARKVLSVEGPAALYKGAPNPSSTTILAGRDIDFPCMHEFVASSFVMYPFSSLSPGCSGAGANLIRLGPHMVLVFVFLEQFKKMAAK